MPGKLVLLAVHAHPDDESLGTGGTLARYAREGVRTVLVCATRGEEGEILNPDMGSEQVPPSMVELRMKELERACETLGIHEVHFLGYRDSGMAGSPANRHPEALANADMLEATLRLVRVMRTVRPHVVITYNEKGIYGHPDHIAVNRITLSAMAATADASRYPALSLPPWRPLKLYYTAIPRSRLTALKHVVEKQGETLDFDVDFLSTPDEDITTRIDVRSVLDVKLKAIRSHRSQMNPRSFLSRMPEPMRSEALGTECYVWVSGQVGAPPRETDLFEGLDPAS